VSLLILVVDDEPDVEVLCRQRFRVTCVLAGSPWSLLNPVRPYFNASAMQ
jgi:hypothetical protein